MVTMGKLQTLQHFELKIEMQVLNATFASSFRPNMDVLYQGIRVFREDDPILGFLEKFDHHVQPVIPLCIYVYLAEFCASMKALIKTFTEKTCNRHYCRSSNRSMIVIKFLWLLYLPIVLATSPRHVVLPQVIAVTVASIVLYVGALRTAAKCINALMLTSVSVILQNGYKYFISHKVQ